MLHISNQILILIINLNHHQGLEILEILEMHINPGPGYNFVVKVRVYALVHYRRQTFFPHCTECNMQRNWVQLCVTDQIQRNCNFKKILIIIVLILEWIQFLWLIAVLSVTFWPGIRFYCCNLSFSRCRNGSNGLHTGRNKDLKRIEMARIVIWISF